MLLMGIGMGFRRYWWWLVLFMLVFIGGFSSSGVDGVALAPPDEELLASADVVALVPPDEVLLASADVVAVIVHDVKYLSMSWTKFCPSFGENSILALGKILSSLWAKFYPFLDCQSVSRSRFIPNNCSVIFKSVC